MVTSSFEHTARRIMTTTSHPHRTATPISGPGSQQRKGRSSSGESPTRVPFLQLLAHRLRGDSGPHRRPSGSCATPGEPLHRAPLSPVGCAAVDGHPAGGAALHPATSRLQEAVRALHLGLCHRGQENNAFFHCLFLNKLPRELCVLCCSSKRTLQTNHVLCTRADSFAAHNSKLSHDVGAAVASP
jgi:hypothetical protein